MEPKDEKALEIARRTRKNLEYMDGQCLKGEPIYEFTQLFNSMLGMIICVREEYYERQPIEWPEIEKTTFWNGQSTLKCKAASFSDLITMVRNAFSHSNYDFVTNKEKKIVGVKLWNFPNGVKQKQPRNMNWWAQFSEKELRELAYLAVNYLEDKFQMGVNGNPIEPSDCVKTDG